MQKKSSRILFLIKNKTFFKQIIWKLKKRPFFLTAADEINYDANYFFNYKFDCKKPRTFNEYLCWLKINYKNNLWKKCADKLGSKSFLEEIGLGQYLPKTYGVYKNASEINLDELPNEFVLKTNHDCGSVFVCSKDKTNFNEVFEKLDKALQKKYNAKNHEWVYEDINPLIFAEEKLVPFEGDELIDYKFFIINHNFAFGFITQNRFIDCRFTIFEEDFKFQKSEYIYLRPKKRMSPKKPNSFDDMMSIAKVVGAHFDLVRVDFYDTNQGPKIGELTFFSQSGLGPFTDKKLDFKYGRYFVGLFDNGNGEH